MMKPRFNKLFTLLVIWRLASVFIVQTSHVPDEYWQSLEVAHKLSFGYGYMTWEWQAGIRSYLYPFFLSIFYFIVKFVNADFPLVIIFGPRVFQALLSAYADYSFYTWTNSKLALLSLCVNWYWYYCATRTLINSFETCLTIIALSKYPWSGHQVKNTTFLWIVGFLCFARPTATVFWLPLCLYHVWKNKYVMTWYLAIGLFYLIISTLIDSMCYGRFTLSPLEFFKINVLNKVSEQYGKMHGLWYLFSGLPVLLGINYCILPLVVYKVISNGNNYQKSLLFTVTIVCSLVIYSLIGHKEFRFILPLLPMLIFVINETIFQERVGKTKKKLFVFTLIVSNVFPGIYFSVLHQKGPLEIMSHLRNDLETMRNSEVDILFLTTCHATPYYSHLHRNVSMRFLTCEPNLKSSKDYIDETDKFRRNPMNWLEINYLNNRNIARLPSHVVIDDSIIDKVEPFLRHYIRLIYCEDTHFAQHGEFNGYVIYKHHTIKSFDSDKSKKHNSAEF
ncbi:GPI mannosyltransferase 3 isoform X1 [Phymastichus coffea]|uniref:GPI mannosyltransferase 3 isoform X1 n=1 Tax=Phymastichus coffea TaxID=108790 RepID=UPI00273C65BA|nr:GPI mannosyltransferase 3 isoform X1 [Phymastichus coffea]